MKISKSIFLIIISISIFSCSTKHENLLKNGDFSNGLTNNWWNSHGMNNNYEVTLSNEIFASPNYSIKISADSSFTSFAHWAQVVNDNIPYNHQVKLKLKIKLDNVKGKGIAIAIRCDDTEQPNRKGEMFATTQGRITISGKAEWKEYEVTSKEITKNIKSITIYLLMLNETTGTVYFDDVVLESI